MKWSKFREFRLTNQWFANETVIRAVLTWEFFLPLKDLREFVRNNVWFIAPRLFESLNLWAEGSIACDFPEVSVRYLIFYHFEGEKREYCDFLSMSQTIRERLECAEKKFGTRIIWDRVVKETIHGKRMGLEIYPFPGGYRLTGLPREKSTPVDPHEIEVHRAYITGTPMPPIMPSPIGG